jgi:outer membrane protein
MLALAPMTAATTAGAETLPEALALAYDSNPTLLQQRAQQRALDETYVQARTGLRPTVSLSATGGYVRNDPPSGPGGDSHSGQLALTASQSLYTGGRTSAEIRAAEATVMAGRQSLRDAEAQLLQQVVQAYTDVRRDQQLLVIRTANVQVLKSQLDETTAKFEVGQVTKTDIAQARAQYAQARAALAAAEGQLKLSRSAYQAVVGQAPGDLAPEPELPGAPATVDAAFDIAEHGNPRLAAAGLSEQASRARIDLARAGRMPTVAANASFGFAGQAPPLNADTYGRQLSATLTVTQPLFSGGLISSQIRQALENNNSDRLGVERARRDTVQLVSNAWNNILTTRSGLSASQEQRDAASIAFEGVREEYRAGLRTTIDVLLAQQALRDADLAVVTARHDEYVARAQLLNALGRLEARSLGVAVNTYDPATSFQKVKNANSTPVDQVVEALDGAVVVHH